MYHETTPLSIITQASEKASEKVSERLSISSSSVSSESQDNPVIDQNRLDIGNPVSKIQIESHSECSPQVDTASIMQRSASLEAKALKILERELTLEKLLAHSKAQLEIFDQQMRDIGGRYVAVRRSTGSVPLRRRVEIPDLPPSPIPQDRYSVREQAVNKSLDEIDADFTRVLKSSKNRPPLAPVPFASHSGSASTNRLSLTKPLLTSLRRRSSLGKEN